MLRGGKKSLPEVQLFNLAHLLFSCAKIHAISLQELLYCQGDEPNRLYVPLKGP